MNVKVIMHAHVIKIYYSKKRFDALFSLDNGYFEKSKVAHFHATLWDESCTHNKSKHSLYVFFYFLPFFVDFLKMNVFLQYTS